MDSYPNKADTALVGQSVWDAYKVFLHNSMKVGEDAEDDGDISSPSLVLAKQLVWLHKLTW